MRIINNHTNTTRNTAIANEIPDDLTSQQTNEAGTYITTATIPLPGNLTFTMVVYVAIPAWHSLFSFMVE